MSVTVTTWAELIAACSGSEDIVWGGASRLESVTLTVASTYNGTPPIVCGDVNIDFNGLTIGTLSTTGTRNYQEGTDNEWRAWAWGFPAVSFYTNNVIKNLTVEHIALESPRDILLTGCKLKNVYCYDIYAPSVEPTSIWLRNSGRSTASGNFKPRAFGTYLIGAGWRDQYEMSGYQPRASRLAAEECIFRLRTANAGITLAAGTYENCELDLDYTFSWEEVDKESHWDKLCIFPANGIYMRNCTFTGTLRLDSSWEILAADVSDSGSPSYTPYPTIWSSWTIFNFKTICDSEFQGVTIQNSYFITGPSGTAFNAYAAIWVTNSGDYRWNDMPDNYKQLLGDLRNIDILQDHEFPCMEDDGYRYPQYNSEDSISPAGQSNYIRRIAPNVNDGLPFIPFWYYPHGSTPPAPVGDDNYNYITIFDMETKQDGFSGNGLAILEPTRCRITEELNGGYTLTLEHPQDKEGKWRFILEMNIIKCLGQLFIIRKVTSKSTAGGKRTYTAYAEHITYHLNDYWLFPGTSIAGYRGQTLIDSILAQMDDSGGDWQTRYSFSITTDMDADPTFKEWYEMPDGHTPYEMILGSNGFTSLIGGELYRDNFTVSIRERMQGAQDNAFIIHPNLNLTSIEKTVDVQTFCTYFRAYDPYGGWWAVAWDPATLPRAYSHNIVRSQNFSFDVEEEYYDMKMLERKGQDYFARNCAPMISFRLKIQDLKNHPDYKEFINNYRFKVGDIGKVWDDEDERYYELEITKTVKNGITGECEEVVIGSERSFTRPAGYPITLDRNFTWYVAGEYDPSNPPEPPEPPYEPTYVDLDYVYTEDSTDITLILYLGNATRVQVPATNGEKTVKTISESCFDGSFNLEAVTIPEGITRIE